MSPEQSMAARRKEPAEVYVSAHADWQQAQTKHAELVAGRATAETVLESRIRLEQAKARLGAARAGVVNAAWATGKLSQVADLSRAVDALLCGVLADARAEAKARSEAESAA